MQQDKINFKSTGYFSSLICDYLDEFSELEKFYNRFPSIKNFKAQIDEKKNSIGISDVNRNILVNVLKSQYKTINASEDTLKNIESLHSQNTFTITTGHQLNLFTGPLYFLYKIISTINLTKILKKNYPDYNFVPIYWMATEDHDFDEINYFNYKGKKFKWHKITSGAVGEIFTNGLDEVCNLFSKDLKDNKNTEELITLFKTAYLKHNTIAEATRFLANSLFKTYGLVIIDANETQLKRLFIPYLEEELLNQKSFSIVSNTNKELLKVSGEYKIQVNPREVNLFYLKKGLRERIVLDKGIYKVLNTEITWKKDEIIKHLNEQPERFSPNVIMRPLYQEVILPNLCYIGGGGELAYWLQLKNYFKSVNVPFPILLLRNSVVLKSEKQDKKLRALNISTSDLFLKFHSFINKKVREISDVEIDFSKQKEHLKKEFETLYDLSEQTDKSFKSAVKAQEAKQLKALDYLEKRLLKAQKRKLSDEVKRMSVLKNELFPEGNLQERTLNFSEIYSEYGTSFIKLLQEELDPLDLKFSMITL